jgi:hypothetical protein
MYVCMDVFLYVSVCVCVCRVLEMGRYTKPELHSDPSFDTDMYQNALYPFIFVHSSHGISLFRFNFEHCVCMYASVCMFVCMHAYKYECMHVCVCRYVCSLIAREGIHQFAANLACLGVCFETPKMF